MLFSLTRLGEPLLMEEIIGRFRANIVISTKEPFEEDLWEEIVISSLPFKVQNSCRYLV